jgi:hypothetical protein
MVLRGTAALTLTSAAADNLPFAKPVECSHVVLTLRLTGSINAGLARRTDLPKLASHCMIRSFFLFAAVFIALVSGCSGDGVSTSKFNETVKNLEQLATASSGATRDQLQAAAAALRQQKHTEAAASLQGLILSPSGLDAQQQQKVVAALVTLQRVLAERAQNGDAEAEKVLIAIRQMKEGLPPRR